VHIENNRGVVVAQHDGIPANWSRPTPGWLPGEYIIDIHPVPIIDYISSETYQVYVGLYDRTTGERVSPNNNTLDETRAYIGSVVIEQ
jgi:hypothetical protein